ncbi:hypothetical protein D1BOALGB6SA_10212 [Olavius sp. associated proteobacterium Delta 1]|nr:hypothetical protein D1BOALGB6SA_10212 [Olavius sp. associated proteobacterium Delta 1]
MPKIMETLRSVFFNKTDRITTILVPLAAGFISNFSSIYQ